LRSRGNKWRNVAQSHPRCQPVLGSDNIIQSGLLAVRITCSHTRNTTMKIEKKYLRCIPEALKSLAPSTKLVPVLNEPESASDRLLLAGFTEHLNPGERIVPDIRIGPKARFNALGKFIKHKDLPKELCYRLIEWTYYQWHGPNKVEVTDWAHIPYHRYQRTLVPPPSQHLTVAVDTNGKKLIAGPSATVAEEDQLLHSINLVLELVGRCEIVDANGEAILTSPEIHLDWDLFPVGEYPWEKVRPALERVISRERPGVRPLIWKRLEAIQKYDPTFRAVGRAGYTGYLVFGFEERNLFICESTKSDNATYVFADDWDTFTKLTKAEVIQGKLAFKRIVHLQDWFDEIDQLFRNSKAA